MSSFPLLDDSAYVSYVQRLSGWGANQTTHLAEIRYPVQSAPIVSVVKLLSPSLLNVCNEAVSWLFLRAAGFAAPKNAAILVLTEKKAKAILGTRLITKDLVHNGYVVAWASKQLDFSSIKAFFAGSRADAEWLKVLQTLHGAQIAAFDEVFLNRDRNTGNVLFSGKGECIPIDHEHVFDYQDWIRSDLNVSQDAESDTLCFLKNSARKGTLEKNAFQDVMSKMVHYSHDHQVALEASKQQVLQLLEKTFPEDFELISERIFAFVAERTAKHWMENKLGIV